MLADKLNQSSISEKGGKSRNKSADSQLSNSNLVSNLASIHERNASYQSKLSLLRQTKDAGISKLREIVNVLEKENSRLKRRSSVRSAASGAEAKDLKKQVKTLTDKLAASNAQVYQLTL